MQNITDEQKKNQFIEFLDCVTKFKKLEKEFVSGPVTEERKKEIENELRGIDSRLEVLVNEVL